MLSSPSTGRYIKIECHQPSKLLNIIRVVHQEKPIQSDNTRKHYSKAILN